jgi:regulator of sigma E protease
VWQRFLVVLAGPVANFILAIVIFTAFFSFVGAPLGNVVGAVKAGTPAAQSGIQPGDEILSVAGRPTPTFADLFNVTAVRPGENVVVEVQRGSSVRDVQVTLATDSLTDSYGHTFKRGMLGITPSDQVLKPMPIAKALPEAVSRTYRLTTAIVDGIGQTIRGRVSVKQIGGPVRVAQTAGAWAEMGVLPFVTLLALFSINLGVINLLPVPMLDGGHLLLYVIEAVRRRPVSAEAMDWAFRGGLALILALLMFVTVNDLGLWDRLQRLIG